VDLATAWLSITTWLDEHAPRTARAVRPPAAEEEIRQAVTRLGHDLPADLLAWWRLSDGMPDDRGSGLFPHTSYRPLPVAEVVGEYERWLKYTDEDCCRPGGGHTEAGETGFGFCTATIPICRDVGGGVLLIDLRPGAKRGRIMHLEAEEGHYPAAWHSVTAMLADTADRLTNPGPQHRYVPTVIDDGVLLWDYASS
jgi:cell wall assembly regulator SMI1